MPLIPSLPYKPGYRPQAEDTSIEVDILYFTRLRQQSLTWRLERFMSFNTATRQMCLWAAKHQDTQLSLRSAYVQRRLGKDWCQHVSSISSLEEIVMIVDPITFAQKIVAILDPLEIPYYIGGSVASSLMGESRYTEDIDLIIELDGTKVQALLAAFLEAAFYISDIA
jgi:hypothetical protein